MLPSIDLAKCAASEGIKSTKITGRIFCPKKSSKKIIHPKSFLIYEKNENITGPVR
jgi:hypothetical protein